MMQRRWSVFALVGILVVAAAIGVALFQGETTPALTLLGALMVAVLAAWAAEHRLNRQLTAAAERHERELDHDREQREADRIHDRRLADLADLRRIVDDVMIALESTGSRLFDTSIYYAGEGNPTRSEDLEERLLDECRAAFAEVRRLQDQIVRLRLRVGADDALVASLDEAFEAAQAYASAMHLGRGEEAVSEASWTFQRRSSDAEDAAVRRTGAIVFDAR